MCVGGALGAAGCLLQALLRNPLASPTVIGTSHAAAFGKVPGVFVGLGYGASLGVSFVAACSGALLVLALARTRAGLPAISVVLMGINLSLFFAALTGLTVFLSRVFPQSCAPTFPASVEQFVGMGRYARERFLGGGTPEDARVVRRCLDETGLALLATRPVDELSGGELRRVLIAQALAQEPRVLLFDEPVQQLDLRHQLEVMELARAFTRRGGTSGVAVLHDLGIAARTCDGIALLHGGGILASGTAREVLTSENLRAPYAVEASVRDCPETGALEVIPLAPATPSRKEPP